MADDLKETGRQDDQRINVSRGELRRAVEQVSR